jgi:hypothetical protein
MKAGQMEPPAVPPELAALRAVEDRVAAFEELDAHPLMTVEAPECTDEKTEKFRAEWGPWSGRKARGSEFCLLPPAPVLTPETAKALVRECVTIVRPGEVLAVRLPLSFTSGDLDYAREYARTVERETGVKVAFIPGEELGVAQAEPGNSPDNRATAEG